MRLMLWTLVAVNIVSAGGASYVSLTAIGSTKDLLQILAGCSVLNVVGLLYLTIRIPKT